MAMGLGVSAMAFISAHSDDDAVRPEISSDQIIAVERDGSLVLTFYWQAATWQFHSAKPTYSVMTGGGE